MYISKPARLAAVIGSTLANWPTLFARAKCVLMRTNVLRSRKAAKISHIKIATVDRHLVCPKCGGMTHPVNYGDDSGIIIDKCAQCGGVWLEKDELDKIQELVEGWKDELPDDLAKYGPKMRQVEVNVDQDLYVHISHFRFINTLINGIMDVFGE